MENPAKMAPSQIPLAPSVFAYSGSMGTTIPSPSIAVKMDRERTENIFIRSALSKKVLL
jgi:hypothetical protein